MHIIKLCKFAKIHVFGIFHMSRTCVSQTLFGLGHRISSTINWMYSNYINPPMCWWGLLCSKPLNLMSSPESTHQKHYDYYGKNYCHYHNTQDYCLSSIQ